MSSVSTDNPQEAPRIFEHNHAAKLTQLHENLVEQDLHAEQGALTFQKVASDKKKLVQPEKCIVITHEAIMERLERKREAEEAKKGMDEGAESEEEAHR